MNHRIFVAFFVCLFFSANGDLLPVTKGMTSDDVARIEFQLAFRLPSADIRLYRLALGF